MSETDEPEEGEESEKADEEPEYERPMMIICAIFGLGPLALPLVWRHPRMAWFWKVLITLGVALLTWGCIWLTKVLIVILWEQWQLLQDVMG